MDEPILIGIGSEVHYAGEGIAIILATTQKQADEAALLVSSTYIDKRVPVLSIQQARSTLGHVNFDSPLKPMVFSDSSFVRKSSAVSSVQVR